MTVASREPDSAQQRTTVGIARLMLEQATGERIPNVMELREIAGTGTGTVQKVLQSLQASGAVELESKQRQGTILLRRNLAALWSYAELRPLTVLMPLPTSWEFQGLASGLREELDLLGIPSTLLFGHGSDDRARAVRDRVADIAIMSVHAAHAARGGSLVTAAELPNGSYYAPDSVIVLSRVRPEELGSHARIGIDRGSADHTSLTDREFPDADFVDVSYAHIPSALTRGVIDAAIWHRSATAMSLADRDLRFWRPVFEHAAAPPGVESAALLVDGTNAPATTVIASMDLARILEKQSAVVEGDLLPSY